MTMTGSPNLNILKVHLRATPSGSKGGYLFQKKAADIVKADPFVEAPGDNSFTPQKIRSKLQQVQGTPKPPKGPEKPRKPYTRYSRKVWDEVKTQNKELKLWEIRKIIGQMWRDLLDHEKAEITDKYESEKVEYDRQLKVYQASPAYQAYLQAKTKGAPVIQESKEAPSPAVGCAGKMSERRIYVQPVKDKDDLDDGLSVKHVAHARFMRNHQLIDMIFSAETILPDVRIVVTTHRMQVLKHQVQSLTMFQEKLAAELTSIEDKYENKKRKFLDSSNEFQDKLKKNCVKAVTEDSYQGIVQ